MEPEPLAHCTYQCMWCSADGGKDWFINDPICKNMVRAKCPVTNGCDHTLRTAITTHDIPVRTESLMRILITNESRQVILCISAKIVIISIKKNMTIDHLDRSIYSEWMCFFSAVLTKINGLVCEFFADAMNCKLENLWSLLCEKWICESHAYEIGHSAMCISIVLFTQHWVCIANGLPFIWYRNGKQRLSFTAWKCIHHRWMICKIMRRRKVCNSKFNGCLAIFGWLSKCLCQW